MSDVEAKLSQKSSEFREVKKQVTLEDMLVALPKDAALVDFLEYYRFDPHPNGDQDPRSVRSLLAFVVRDSEPVVLLDLGPVALLMMGDVDYDADFRGRINDGKVLGTNTILAPKISSLAASERY